MKKEMVGIAGVGFVGGAVRAWFEGDGAKLANLVLYDKFKSIGSFEELDGKARIVFVCVPTPYHQGKGYDDSALHDVVKQFRHRKIVVIKSTVIPGSADKFQKKYKKHKFLFNPEFLVEKTAVHDFLHPHRQIVGYTKESKPLAKKIMALLPKAPIARVMPATEAELVKYFGNAFLATKVIFANQIYDICAKLGVDYETIKEAAAHDPRIGASHLRIFKDGYRGYSGSCFPKDVKALIDFSVQVGAPAELLRHVDVLNEALLKNNRIKNAKPKR